MKQLSFVDLNYLINEFKILENSRVDNFYYENETFYIRCYVKQKGHLYLTNKISKYIYIGNSKEDSSHPSSFIQFLRKYLKNSFIREINLIEGERIIKISFESKINENIETYIIYLELFSNGNIIITDKENIIKNSLKKKKFKDRKVMVRESYELPPKKKLTLKNLNNLEKELKSSDLEIVKFLAINFGIGGKYAEEICHNIKTNKKTLSKDFNKIKELEKELSELLNQKILPHIIKEDNQIKDFFPFKFNSKKNLEKIDSFNQIIKTYYESFKDETDNNEKEFEKKLKKLQNRISKQEKMKEEISKSSKEFSEIGEKIYENYDLIDNLIKEINKASKDKGWDHVNQTIKSNEKLNKIIKKLNYKNNEIILEL